MRLEPRASVLIPANEKLLEGDLVLPRSASGLVIFAHGSGSSRLSPRNKAVASTLQDSGVGTLLFDLLTGEEEARDRIDGHIRFNIGFLASRLVGATRWVQSHPRAGRLALGYFGASTGAAAALVAASDLGAIIRAVVSRGGRPDLAGEALAKVQSPTLLIVGGNDTEVIRLNEFAFRLLRCEKDLSIVPGATHLFEEAGALEKVAALAVSWFKDHFTAAQAAPASR